VCNGTFSGSRSRRNDSHFHYVRGSEISTRSARLTPSLQTGWSSRHPPPSAARSVAARRVDRSGSLHEAFRLAGELLPLSKPSADVLTYPTTFACSAGPGCAAHRLTAGAIDTYLFLLRLHPFPPHPSRPSPFPYPLVPQPRHRWPIVNQI